MDTLQFILEVQKALQSPENRYLRLNFGDFNLRMRILQNPPFKNFLFATPSRRPKVNCFPEHAYEHPFPRRGVPLKAFGRYY